MALILLCTNGAVFAEDNQLKDPPLKGKEALYGGGNQSIYFALEDAQPETLKCIDECIRRNQMASVGFAMIEEQCKSGCAFESNLVLLESPNKKDYERAVKALSETNDPRAVQPLIIALQRDLTERSGLWAWIIPALGSLGDPAAIPALTHTLTMNGDDWLGRDMSAQALGDIDALSAIEPLLSAAWSAETRDTVIKSLVSFRDKRATPIFLSALDSEEEEQTREAAIKGLKLLGLIAVPEMMEAFSYFSSEHPETSKRIALCRLLGASGDERATGLLQKSVTDPDKVIKQCAERFIKRRNR